MSTNNEPPKVAAENRPQRKSKLISLEEAGKMIADCKTVSISGVTLANAPMALVRAAIRAGAKGLTVIPSAATGIACELLICAGCVDTYYNSYTSLEFLGFAPAFRKAGETKSIKIIESDEAFIIWGVKAAANGFPFIPVQQIYESTDLPKVNPLLRTIKDPYTGREVTTIPPLESDFFICHVQQADEFGNCQIWGGTRIHDDYVRAAKKVIVSCDELVPVEKTRQEPIKTSIAGWMVDAVVHLPYGAHPATSPGCYKYDEEHLRMYQDMVRSGRGKEYLARFVYEPKEHYEYLERIGVKKLLELRRFI